ncbi:MAG: tubulin/FtsZ family protein [Dehalococcoidales bacterium]|jgi:cell division GTPase FtsZ
MKLIVVGFGQCGGKIADEFCRLNSKARFRRGIEIIPGTFAVNTDAADLSSLSSIKSDYQHRILIGNRKTGSHGVGKINEMGAQIAKQDGDKVIDAVGSAKRFYEADAFLLIAGAAGGTGSGSMPVIAQTIKKRYGDKPVYALVVLPFEHEEVTEARTIYNSAMCLKAAYSVANAVFLVDNQRYVKKDSSLINNMAAINRLIVEPFYDLLCTGEETKAKFIGARLLDGGDIIQTLGGWTVLGYGKSQLPIFRLPFERRRNFRKKSQETHKGMQAMDQAISNLSLRCNPEDSNSALYLLSAPKTETNMDLVKELGDSLRDAATEAVIRYGDYPRAGGTLKITVILSQLKDVEKVRVYYNELPDLIQKKEKRQEATEAKLEELLDASTAVPSLL